MVFDFSNENNNNWIFEILIILEDLSDLATNAQSCHKWQFVTKECLSLQRQDNSAP